MSFAKGEFTIAAMAILMASLMGNLIGWMVTGLFRRLMARQENSNRHAKHQ